MLNEKQKENFLKLAYQMALIDNNLNENEKIMIESYCNEMQISIPEDIREESIDGIIESMGSECTVVEKKIIIFEILGLALVDGSYDKSEKNIVEAIVNTFEIGENFLLESENVLREYIEMQGKINTLILE